MTETCHNCGTVAETALLTFRNGLVGRVCPKCRTCRRGRPYASKREVEAAKLHEAGHPAKVEHGRGDR